MMIRFMGSLKFQMMTLVSSDPLSDPCDVTSIKRGLITIWIESAKHIPGHVLAAGSPCNGVDLGSMELPIVDFLGNRVSNVRV